MSLSMHGEVVDRKASSHWITTANYPILMGAVGHNYEFWGLAVGRLVRGDMVQRLVEIRLCALVDAKVKLGSNMHGVTAIERWKWASSWMVNSVEYSERGPCFMNPRRMDE